MIAQTIKQNVDGKVSTASSEGINSTIVQKVVDSLAQAEIQSRADKLTKALVERDKLQTEFYKCRPDIAPTTDEEGKQIMPASYSKDALKKRNEAIKKLEDFDAKIDSAVEKGNYDKL